MDRESPKKTGNQHMKRKLAFLSTFLRVILMAALVVILTFPSPALAQTPRIAVSVDPRNGSVEDIFHLSITVSSSDSISQVEPVINSNGNFEVTSSGTEQRMNIINGVTSASTILYYDLTPAPSLKPGTYKLSQSRIIIDGQDYALEIPAITIGGRKAPSAGAAGQTQASSEISFRQIVTNETPYVGEQIVYQAMVTTKARLVSGAFSEMDFPKFFKESFGDKAELALEMDQGKGKIHIYRESLFPLEAGEIAIPERAFDAIVEIPIFMRQRRQFGSLFGGSLFGGGSTFDQRKKRLLADPLKVTVKPLPPAPKNAPSYIPVGDVKLTVGITKEKLDVGESLDLTIELGGNANLRPVELPEPYAGDSDAFKVYTDTLPVETWPEAKGIGMRKTFKLALVPTRPGQLALPQYSFLVFDPKTGKYESKSTGARVISVSGDGPKNLPANSSSSKINSIKSDKQKTGDIDATVDLSKKADGQYRENNENFIPYSTANSSLPVIPSWLLTAVLLSLPALITWGVVGKQLKQRKPSLARQQEAAIKQLQAALKDNSPSPDKLDPNKLAIELKRYFALMLSLPEASTTLEELQDALEKGLNDKYQATSVRVFLNKVEEACYSSSTTKSADLLPENVVSDFAAMLTALHASLKQARRIDK
ncbi:MAG: BatD family protein [bacterium]|nr:BatD family protein [bacterium]